MFPRLINFNCLLFSVIVSFVVAIQNRYCHLSCDFVFKKVNHTVCDRDLEKCGPAYNCGPDFKMIQLNDDDRQYILDIHNYLRNKVALGYEKRGYQPAASNMNAMNYNKELEYISQCWANTCNGNPLIHDVCRRTNEQLPPAKMADPSPVSNISRYAELIIAKNLGYFNTTKRGGRFWVLRSKEVLRIKSDVKVDYEHVGQNLGYINSSNPDIDIIKSMKDIMLLWYDEVSIFNNTWIDDTKERGVKVGHYTQLVWADTLEIGCALTYYTTNGYNRKWNHIVFVCNYGPGGNYIGRPVYKVGKSCSRCPKGSKQNKKYKGLCGRVRNVNERN